MRVKQIALGVSVVVILLGTVLVTMATGLWSTSGGSENGNGSGNGSGNGNTQAIADPAGIKGSSYFTVVSESFDIPLDVLAAAFQIDTAEIAMFRCKDLVSIFDSSDGKEIGAESVRLFVALYKGLPYDLSETIYLPAPAVKILTDAGNITKEQAAYIAAHIK